MFQEFNWVFTQLISILKYPKCKTKIYFSTYSSGHNYACKSSLLVIPVPDLDVSVKSTNFSDKLHILNIFSHTLWSCEFVISVKNTSYVCQVLVFWCRLES